MILYDMAVRTPIDRIRKGYKPAKYRSKQVVNSELGH